MIVPLQEKYDAEQQKHIKDFLENEDLRDGLQYWGYYVKTPYATNGMGNTKAR